jgi:glyoxalase family protein
LEQPISGIHHVTAIASDPQRNLDFYTEVLGLRLVKRTVNFDDPGSYHLYFGDEVGTPGSILTFFAWPMARRGSPGVGQVEVTSFSILEPSVGYWERRLLSAGIPVERSGKRFDEEVLTFADPDGLKLEMVAHSQPAGANRAWKDASVPAQHAIRGFYSVTLCEQGYESTVEVLETMGFKKVGERGNRFRFEVGKGGAGARLDILCASEASYGNVAVGIVHHVAVTFIPSIFANQVACCSNWLRILPASPLTSPQRSWAKRSSCRHGWSQIERESNRFCRQSNCTNQKE